MIDSLTQQDLILFIEKYGNGDIYFSHYKDTTGKITIKYLPMFTKLADEDNIADFKKELTEHPHLKDKYLKEIIITNKFAYIPNDDFSSKNPLVLNYKKFLDNIKQQTKYSTKVIYCKPSNLKNNKQKNKHIK